MLSKFKKYESKLISSIENIRNFILQSNRKYMYAGFTTSNFKSNLFYAIKNSRYYFIDFCMEHMGVNSSYRINVPTYCNIIEACMESRNYSIIIYFLNKNHDCEAAWIGATYWYIYCSVFHRKLYYYLRSNK